MAAGEAGLDRKVTGGYASDLLSCVMAGAQTGNVWVTLQAHPEYCGGGRATEPGLHRHHRRTQPDAETVERANERGIPILLSDAGIFTVVGRLTDLGIQAAAKA